MDGIEIKFDEKELERLLTQEEDLVKKVSHDSARKTSGMTTAAIKTASPKRTGAYASGWTYELNEAGTGYIVHNRDHYQLTHLLEKGHAKRNGGRVPAIVHIAPAEQRGVRVFLTMLKNGIENG